MKIINRALKFFMPAGFIILFTTVIIINIVSPATNFNFIPVQAKHTIKSDAAYLASLPLIKDYATVSLKGEHILILKGNSFINFISPKTSIPIDNLYALAFITILVFFILTFWKVELENLRNKQLVSFLGKVEVTLAIAWILNILRHFFLRRYFLNVTNDEYTLDFNVFIMPEFWILFLVNRLKVFISKEIELKKS